MTTKRTSRLDALINHPPRSTVNWIARIVMFLLAMFLGWSSFAHLEEFAMAEGEVVPQEQVQAIQHLEGGIIEDIMIREGEHVTAGQPLVQLNITSFIADREELEVQMQALHLKKARLEAEAAGEETLTFKDGLAGYRPNIINSELQTFESRKLKLHSSLSLLREQLHQKELDVKQLEAEKASIIKNLALLREKLKISSELIKDQLTSKLEHLQLEAETEELEGRLDVVKVAIPRARAALEEAEERLRNETLSFRNEVQEELSEVEAEISRTEEQLAKATDQVQRTTIKSPIDGVVKDLKFHTLGGVIQPGEIIMEIVPQSENLVVEARLDPKDIGFVKEGQRALVKFHTYDYARYGGLEGEVIYVSADSYTDEKNDETYFKVVTRTDKNFLGSKKTQFPITAGMQATIDINTGSKTVMEYILKPVIKIKDEAFRER